MFTTFLYRKHAFVGAAAIAVATTTAPASSLGQEEVRQLEEILITAERRVQSLQNVSVSATVFDAEAIKKQGIEDVYDLENVAPNVQIDLDGRSTFINIRGVGIAQSAPTSVPGVAFYVDGVLVPHEQFLRQSMYDLEAIEVLRGPQGTLTGQNSTGGAIYVRSTQPRYNEVSGVVDLQVGNYNRRRAMVGSNFSNSDNLAVRLSGIHDTRNSFYTNAGSSANTPGGRTMDAIRTNIAMRSDDDRLRVWLRAEYYDVETGDNPVKRRDDPNPDPFVLNEDANAFLNINGHRLVGEIKYEVMDGIDARLVTAWQDGEVKNVTDGDKTTTAPPVPMGVSERDVDWRADYPGRVTEGFTEIETFTTEFNLISTDDSPLQWVVGAFYMDESIPVDLLRDHHHTVELIQVDNKITATAANRSASIFGQVNWFATDRIELVLGARNSWDKQRYSRFALGNPAGFPAPIVSVAKSNEWTGKAGINYHLEGGTLLYLTASKGYKAGGNNLVPGQPAFEPERNYVYELGAKTEFLDRRVRLNAAAFYSKYKGVQLISLRGGLPFNQNAAPSRILGFEVEAVAQLENLRANWAIGYLDSQTSEAGCLNDGTGLAEPPAYPLCLDDMGNPTGNNLVPDGTTMPYAPEWSLQAGAQYDIALPNVRSLTPRLQWNYVSKAFSTVFHNSATIKEAHHLVDARLSYEINESWLVEAYAKNVLDEIYIDMQDQNSSSADGGYEYGSPRTFGLRMVVRIGG